MLHFLSWCIFQLCLLTWKSLDIQTPFLKGIFIWTLKHTQIPTQQTLGCLGNMSYVLTFVYMISEQNIGWLGGVGDEQVPSYKGECTKPLNHGSRIMKQLGFNGKYPRVPLFFRGSHVKKKAFLQGGSQPLMNGVYGAAARLSSINSMTYVFPGSRCHHFKKWWNSFWKMIFTPTKIMVKLGNL